MKPAWLMVFLCSVAAVSQAAPIPFNLYSRLYVGMRESALMAQAGHADYVADAGLADLPASVRDKAGSAAIRQYEWKGDAAIPYNTIVSVSGGVVVSIMREPNF